MSRIPIFGSGRSNDRDQSSDDHSFDDDFSEDDFADEEISDSDYSDGKKSNSKSPNTKNPDRKNPDSKLSRQKDAEHLSETDVNEPENSEEDKLLRPTRMFEMVGQRKVYERIEIAVEAARKRGQPLGHILFDGPPGLGKTTFATCIPRELGVSFQIGNGATLKAPKDIVPYLTNAEEGSVLFIDEIHRMQKAVEEFLYPAMEDFRIDLTLGEGVNARTLNIQLKPFTLIGATTRTGLISAPLRDRFQMREHLDFYSIEELAEIVRRNAKKLNIEIEDEASVEIARRSRGTPRLANNRLRWVRDFADARADGRILLTVAQDALEMQGIDSLGLDSQDRKYLETIVRVFKGGPVGYESVAHTMNVAPDTIVDEVEPFLLRSELMIRTKRGRCLTDKGFLHLGYDPNKFNFDFF